MFVNRMTIRNIHGHLQRTGTVCVEAVVVSTVGEVVVLGVEVVVLGSAGEVEVLVGWKCMCAHS